MWKYADLEMDHMPVGCAVAYPKPAEKNNNRVSENQINPFSGSWEVALNELPRSKMPSTAPTNARCKKRNKRSSLVFEDGQEAAKKTKCDDIPTAKNQESRIFRNSRMKKVKKNRQWKNSPAVEESGRPSSAPPGEQNFKRPLKRKAEKPKPKSDDLVDITSETNNSGNAKPKNVLPRWRHPKTTKTETSESEKKARMEDITLEEELMFELENIHIGSNENSASLPVRPPPPVPAALKKLNGYGSNENHIPTQPPPLFPTAVRSNAVEDYQENQPRSEQCPTDGNSNTLNLKKLAKWTKKRWNKDQKGATRFSSLCSVVVHNLPVVMSSVFQQRLIEVFEKYGPITNIGPAITRPVADGEASFSTTIFFETEDAATKALDEDHTYFGGSEIRVVRPNESIQSSVFQDTDPEEDLGLIFGDFEPGECRSGMGDYCESSEMGVLRPIPETAVSHDPESTEDLGLVFGGPETAEEFNGLDDTYFEGSEMGVLRPIPETGEAELSEGLGLIFGASEPAEEYRGIGHSYLHGPRRIPEISVSQTWREHETTEDLRFGGCEPGCECSDTGHTFFRSTGMRMGRRISETVVSQTSTESSTDLHFGGFEPSYECQDNGASETDEPERGLTALGLSLSAMKING